MHLHGVAWRANHSAIVHQMFSTFSPLFTTRFLLWLRVSRGPYRGKGDDMADHKQSQSDKFKEAARELQADEDEKRWEERLRKIAKAKPEKPE